MRFPGKRGLSNKVDFHLFPLSFHEFVTLNKRISQGEIELLRALNNTPLIELLDGLFDEFGSYLLHGGFLTAINDMAKYGYILPATFSTYGDWIRGDFLKRNKQEHYLREILEAIIIRYGSQITWNSLSDDLSIDHPKTVADYVSHLVFMDVAFVQPALMEDKLTAFPKKAKKVMFTDPFIFHAIKAWLKPCEHPFVEQVKPLLLDAEASAQLVEACVAVHYSRLFPTFFIKAKGEVNIAYVDKKSFRPIEVEWTTQLRPKSLKQIAKYNNDFILTRSKHTGEIQGIPTKFPYPFLFSVRDLFKLTESKKAIPDQYHMHFQYSMF